MVLSQNESIKKDIDDIRTYLDDRLNHLNNFILYVKSQTEMLTGSKLWRLYTLLGKIKRKIFGRFKSNSNNIQYASPTPSQTEENNSLSPRAKKIYNMLKDAIKSK